MKFLGLPGLYQNWLISALDPSVQPRLLSVSNFKTVSPRIKFIKKLDQNLDCLPHDVHINCWVKDENFVWYLYNFLEKTDEVHIMVDSLIGDLFSKAQGTVAFDGLLKHFVGSYNITESSNYEYCYHSAIEYFYFLLCNKTEVFKLKAQHTFTGIINVEYNEFSDKNLLAEKFIGLPNFDLQHFNNQYQLLEQRNSRYLHKQQTFINKFLNSEENFDILELSYLGYIINKLTNNELDWANPLVRETYIKSHRQDICKILESTLRGVSV